MNALPGTASDAQGPVNLVGRFEIDENNFNSEEKKLILDFQNIQGPGSRWVTGARSGGVPCQPHVQFGLRELIFGSTTPESVPPPAAPAAGLIYTDPRNLYQSIGRAANSYR